MRKTISLILALMLALSVPAVPATAEENKDGSAVGYLSFLKISEEELEARREAELPAYEYLKEHGVIEDDEPDASRTKVVFYDSLNAMLMALQAGEVTGLNVPDCTAKYLCAVNDNIKQTVQYHPEKAEGFSQDLLDRLCNGYSFMFMEENSGLRDQFDQALAEMRADGTLEELIRIHITEGARRGEPEAVTFEKFDGEAIRVAVTGALPPIDYVAADGSFAGFNTAILAEIGKRLEKNIELVQVDSLGRALALAQGNVDVAFWTRGLPEKSYKDGIYSMSEEELKTYSQGRAAEHTEEENAIMGALARSYPFAQYAYRDWPDGAIITLPYYTDMNVLVTLK